MKTSIQINHCTQEELFAKSKTLVPGGVHSPVRSFKGLHTTPRFIQRGEGAYIYDIDQVEYIDFCMSFGPLILGHRHPSVETALHKALENGWSFGAAEPYSLELADFLIDRLPHVEQLRFVNSGTEAVMTALRLARGITQKNKIIKFNGCYHGHVDSMLIRAGSGLAGMSEASSAGVPKGVTDDTLILELGDKEGVIRAFEEHKNCIAAIIIEPLPANNGLIIQPQSFLKFLRDITTQENALLVFDEVISGFRVAFGGMSEVTQIKPDLVTLGKIIGGGLPVGAIGGSRKFMEYLAPVGPVYQAGTLSANPLAMIGGLATLKELTPACYNKLEMQTRTITSILKDWIKTHRGGIFQSFNIISYSSLFWIVPQDEIHSMADIPANLSERYKELFAELLNRGIYLAPNAYEVGFVSTAHNDQIIGEMARRLS